MNIVILLYDNMTALDAIGPYEVLSRIPGANLKFVGPEKGMITTDTGFLRLSADYGIGEVDAADLLLVPGGPGDAQMRENDAVLEWIRKIHQTTQFTTSVCTGSLILAKAGVLDGVSATTHWARLSMLLELGAVPVEERVVDAGKIITAAGVSSGIDMALLIAQKVAGDDLAQGLQLGIEYDPQPPFNAGSPKRAPAHVVEMVTAMMNP